MELKTLVNSLGTLMLIQFSIGLMGIQVSNSWIMVVGWLMLIITVWAMIKVNKK